MIKGRLAEALIEELFLLHNYKVFRCGRERMLPGIKLLSKYYSKDRTTNVLRYMPDFVVQAEDKNKVYFIEVKFRGSGNYSKKDLPANYPYDNCYFVVVSKKHIKCLKYKELMDDDEITPTSTNYLGNKKEFELNNQTVSKFCDLAAKYFKEV